MAAGGFRTQPKWIKVAFITMAIGFLLDLFGFALGMGDTDRTTVALLVAGFLCFLIAAIIALIVAFLEEVRASRIAKGCLVIFAVAAGVLTIAAIGVWGARLVPAPGPSIGCYATMVALCGSTLAILAGLFTTLDLAGCCGHA